MKIIIFGATGNTGLCAVKAAIDKGHTTKVFIRDASKLHAEYKDKVEVIVGDALNYSHVLNAVKGVEAVTVVLGTRGDLKPTTDMSEAFNNIVKAMKECNIEVISVCLSLYLFWDIEKVPSILHDINAEHQRMFDILKASGLKYIACMPPRIDDQPGGEYKIQHDDCTGLVVSKYDLGKFLVESLSQPEHYGKACGIYTINAA